MSLVEVGAANHSDPVGVENCEVGILPHPDRSLRVVETGETYETDDVYDEDVADPYADDGMPDQDHAVSFGASGDEHSPAYAAPYEARHESGGFAEDGGAAEDERQQ